MSDGPLVSIIIRNYNYEKFVAAAIDSALSQTYEAIEVIVVDDGSNDNSRHIISSYGDRITSVFQDNGGEGFACCSGFKACNGEIVIFLDSDDSLNPDAAETVVAAWCRGTVKVQYALDWIDGDGHPLGKRWPLGGMPRNDVMHYIRIYGFYPSPPMSGNAFARSFLDRVLPPSNGDWPKGIDTYFIALAPLYGDVTSIDQSLGCYRIHGRNMSEVAGVDLPRLRDRLQIQVAADEALRKHAARLGRPLDGPLVMNIPRHCKARLLSLIIDRTTHPFPKDQVWRLVAAGIRASWRYPFLNFGRRLLFTLSFPILPLFPDRWLFTGLGFLTDSRSRGEFFRKSTSGFFSPANRSPNH